MTGSNVPSPSGGRILIIEDDEALARLLRGHLERAGHEVHVMNLAKPALAFAAEQQMDVVVLDILLPDMSGYDVCVELRRLYHPWILPIVILISLNQPKQRHLGFTRGAEAYLTKPVQAVDFVGTVAVMLHRAKQRGEAPSPARPDKRSTITEPAVGTRRRTP